MRTIIYGVIANIVTKLDSISINADLWDKDKENCLAKWSPNQHGNGKRSLRVAIMLKRMVREVHQQRSSRPPTAVQIHCSFPRKARRTMSKAAILRKVRKAIKDSLLVKALQSEIKYELSNPRFQNSNSGSIGDFMVEWDSPQSQDVVLHKKCESGEELAISAMLGDETHQGDDTLPREALMKVCVAKTGLSPILQFDCKVSAKGQNGSEFSIQHFNYLQSSNSLGSSVYRGPLFSDLDLDLQNELKQYLATRGIGEKLTSYLLLHLHKKEQNQYVNWLHKLEAMVAEKKSSEQERNPEVISDQ